MTRYVFTDETKARGYVMAAVAITDVGAARKVIRQLVQPGNRRLHMVDERPRRRPGIVDTITALPIGATIYDAGRRYRTDRDARKACFDALAINLAINGTATRLVIEEDATLKRFDQQCLIEAVRKRELQQLLSYEHTTAHVEPLLALPDVIAWCWVRSGQWRRALAPILRGVHNV